jgi:hypothetical protein
VARKNTRLTRIYKDTNDLLEQAKEESGKTKIEILELLIHDALFGRRDLNEYMDNLEHEIKDWFRADDEKK